MNLLNLLTTIITVGLITVAAARITRLVTIDKITEPARKWIIDHNGPDGWWTYLVHCPWCFGIWVAAPAAAVAWFATPLGTMLPIDWWFGAPAAWFTIAYTTGWMISGKDH